MTEIIAPLVSLVAMANLVLAVVVLYRGVREKINIIFSLLALTVVLWCFAIIGFYSIKLSQNIDPRFWILLTHSSAALMCFLFLYFTSFFPNSLTKKTPIFLFALAPFAVMNYYLFFTYNIIGNVIDSSYEINKGYIFYALYIILYFFIGYVFLFFQYRKAKLDIQRIQLKYILVGSVLASLLGSVTDLVFPFFGIFSYAWLGPLFSFIFVGFLAYAIFKHHLFDIKLIATELFVALLALLLFGELFLAKTTTEFIIKLVILLLVGFLGVLLIRGVMREVSTRQKMEVLAAELEKANKELKLLDRAKSDFISIASHQLRTPLTAIKGFTSMILEGSYGDINDEVRDKLGKTFESAERLTTLVNDLLDLSHMEGGKMKFEFIKIDLAVLVASVISELAPQAQHKNLKLEFAKPEKEIFVRADEEKMRQVIMNLIDNAIKYTDKGSVTVAVVKEQNEGQNFAKFSVKDTGVGMSAAEIPNLFQKFVRGGDAPRYYTEGSGVGLYVAKLLVEAHQGKVWAESEGEGKGSTFIVRLPEYRG